jgi:RimJ/RimL family protein N-acetyltransferase
VSEPFWIHTDRLILRPWQDSDVDRLVLLTQDPYLRSEWGVFRDPLDRERAREWVQLSLASLQEHGLGSWAVLENAHLIGVASLLPRWLDLEPEPLLSVEYRLLRSAWGRGLATEAIQGLMDYGIQSGHTEIHAIVPRDNVRAKNVAFKVGMTFLRHGRIEGVHVDIYRWRSTPDDPQSRFGRTEKVA